MHYFIITGIEQKEFETFIDLAVSRILDGEVDEADADLPTAFVPESFRLSRNAYAFRYRG